MVSTRTENIAAAPLSIREMALAAKQQYEKSAIVEDDKPVIYHIGISGGKDSTALLLWYIYESGLPLEQLVVTFSDTRNEHEWTYWYVRWLSKNIFKIHWIRAELGFYDLVKQRRRFPSQMARFCTQYLKMMPSKLFIQELQAKGYRVMALSGVRASESADRAKLPPTESAAESYFGCEQMRPLLTWKIADVWAIHERYGVPRNPLYYPTRTTRTVAKKGFLWSKTILGLRPTREGAARVGCYPCINSRKNEMRNIAWNFPSRIADIRRSENETNELRLAHDGNERGLASFFYYEKVPRRFRSRVYNTAPKPPKDTIVGQQKGRKKKATEPVLFEGDVVAGVAKASVRLNVCSIDDVVAWALETPPENLELDFEFEDTLEIPPACDTRYGACE
jgi:3'-phosphoadenosine 5'-phosphosulfate sulfotransferase (PAPS reductase)/FAD synthetase